MLHLKKGFTTKRKLKYLFSSIFLLWLLASIYVAYQYLLLTSKQEVAKWGTFVEGIFDTTSFLPYLRNDEQSRFYQQMLYKKCLGYTVTDHDVDFVDEMCHVATKDYQTYAISLNSGHTRSDGVPVSLEDVFFTYNDILVHNLWGISYLDQYAEVQVSTTEDAKIQVVFPSPSVDNALFFTNFALPRHVLFDADIKTYQKVFAVEPVYNKCARIVPQTTDPYSLVFDLSSCEESSLGFYQIKNTNSFEQFAQAVNTHGSIIDAYEHPTQLSWYIPQKLSTNQYVTLFFNTQSKKSSVRIRRSLAWFIQQNFYQTGYEQILGKYDDELFSTFLSTWERIDEFLGRVDSTQVIPKWDLEDIWVTRLPDSITITGTEQKIVHFVESITNTFPLELKFDAEYDKISISHNGSAGYEPKSYNKKDKSWKYNISPNLDNLTAGLNKYTIYGFVGTDKKTIATIDLYNLKWWAVTQDDLSTAATPETLVIVYYDDPVSNEVIARLQKIFTQENIIDRFQFVQMGSIEEMEGKLLAGDYDIILNTINMGFKKDISKILASDKVQINHSQYQNARLVSFIQQYLQAKDDQKKILANQINEIYAKDMPFLMLGTKYHPLYIKETAFTKLNLSGTSLHLEDRRQKIYQNLHLVENINIDVDNARNFKKFKQFLQYSLKAW